MPFLFFDTETTGLPLWREPSDDPRQPYIIQLAAILQDDDGQVIKTLDALIKPEGWEIPEQITSITKITMDMVQDAGRPLAEVLSEFVEMANGADIVAHNAQFDMRMLRIALMRLGGHDAFLSALKEKQIPIHCTADMATPIVNLPPTTKMKAAGFKKPKRCKLEEAVRFFFDEPLDGAHNALVDVEACARIFWHMKAMEAKV